MRCFVHNFESVGTCKNCAKGLCRECLVDCGNGLACVECEACVKSIDKYLDSHIHKKIKPQFSMGIILGVFFISLGIAGKDIFNNVFLTSILIVMGSIMLFNAYPFRPRKNNTD